MYSKVQVKIKKKKTTEKKKEKYHILGSFEPQKFGVQEKSVLVTLSEEELGSQHLYWAAQNHL